MKTQTKARPQREVTITRLIDAPRERVFDAWTKAEQVARWWGPETFTNADCVVDARPGGRFHLVMRSPEGEEYPVSGSFQEVRRPERLVYGGTASDAAGKPALEWTSTVTFEERKGRTLLTVYEKAVGIAPSAPQMLAGMHAGLHQMIERLAARATGEDERSIVLLRVYPFPRERVFKAFSERDQLERWWGPRGFTVRTRAFDCRTGGAWDFTFTGPDGKEYPNYIRYTEVKAPERQVHEHGAVPGGKAEFHAQIDFYDLGGATQVVMRSVFPSAAVRDKVVKVYNAIEGGRQTLERLEDHLSGTFTLSRLVDAPRDRVWRAWTEGKALAAWFGPKGFNTFRSKLDLKPGGTYHYGIRGGQTEMWGKWTFLEIAAPERLVFISGFSDEKGGLGRHPLAPEWPRQFHSTVLFQDMGGRTLVTVKWRTHEASESERKVFAAGFESMNGGWTGTFERLEGHLKGEA